MKKEEIVKLITEKIQEKIGVILEDGEPANVTAGVAKVDKPIKDNVLKRKALEDAEKELENDGEDLDEAAQHTEPDNFMLGKAALKTSIEALGGEHGVLYSAYYQPEFYKGMSSWSEKYDTSTHDEPEFYCLDRYLALWFGEYGKGKPELTKQERLYDKAIKNIIKAKKNYVWFKLKAFGGNNSGEPIDWAIFYYHLRKEKFDVFVKTCKIDELNGGYQKRGKFKGFRIKVLHVPGEKDDDGTRSYYKDGYLHKDEHEQDEAERTECRGCF